MSRKGLEFKRHFGRGRVVSISSRDLVTCSPSATIGSVLGLMIGGKRKIPVTEAGVLKGIVTTNDILDYAGAGKRHEHFDSKDPLRVRVGRIAESRVITMDAGLSLDKAFAAFKEYRRGSYPVVRDGKLVGMVSDWDFMKCIRGNVGIPVEELMIRRPAHVKEHYSVHDVARIMVRGGYRRLPVSRNGILTGIVLPTDILRYLQSEGLGSLGSGKAVHHVMEREVRTVGPKADVGSAVRIMLASKVGGLPVVEDRELLGIITESDVVQAMA